MRRCRAAGLSDGGLETGALVAGQGVGVAGEPVRDVADGRRGDRQAARRLADLLAKHGDPDGHRARVMADALAAGRRVVELMSEPITELDELRARAAAGDLAGLRTQADAGNVFAGISLANVLIKQGRGEEAEQLRRFGLNPDGLIAYA
jgi:hypothetical protein